MKSVVTLLAALLLLAGAPLTHADLNWLQGGTAKTEAGAIPLEGLTPNPIKLRVHPNQAAAVYDNQQFQRRLGILPGGREVTIIAIGKDDRFKVRGQALHAGVSGWLKASDLVSQHKNFVGTMRALYQRQMIVADLIKKKQIALGLTPEEVMESLGKPTATNSKLTQAGRVETFDYVTYERIPQTTTRRDQYGNLYNSVHYVEVQTGKLSVGFENGVVSSIEETEGNPLGEAAVRAVPLPIQGWW